MFPTFIDSNSRILYKKAACSIFFITCFQSTSKHEHTEFEFGINIISR
jgi:hypothetical protein